MSELSAKEQYDKAFDFYSAGKYKKSTKWLRKAAEEGYAKAQYSLGAMYASGHGVEQSYPEAVKWWRKAAEQGDFYAQVRLEMLGECK